MSTPARGNRPPKSPASNAAAAAVPIAPGWLATLLLAATALTSHAAGAEPAHALAPRLVVVISVDHFGSDLFGQWRARFDGGIARLAREGVVYANAYYSHARTETCPGHATLLSGAHPSGTGMVANLWYDTERGKEVYCTASSRLLRADDASAAGRGPDNMMVSTLGDWLKAARPDSRVVSVAGKDRAAITMAGHDADAVFWLVAGVGFTTFVAPGNDPHSAMAPVADFNAAMQRDWQRNPPVWTYTDARCAALENDYTFGEQRWQSRLPPVGWHAEAGLEGVWPHVDASPFLDELTLDAARELIRYYRLGQREAADLLAIGLAATDSVAHRFGTQGPEMCDLLSRLDRMLDAFLADLDALGIPYLVVLTADHGGVDFPERLQMQGYPEATRLEPTAWLEPINEALQRRFNLSAPPLVSTYDNEEITQLYAVGNDGRALPEPLRTAVLASARQLAAAAPQVVAVFTQAELLAGAAARSLPPDELTLHERFVLSTYSGRSGDLQVAFQPRTVPYRAIPGQFVTSHGSPWNYDRTVPLIFWWPEANHQERALPVAIVNIAPTLARLLGVQPPDSVDGSCMPLPGTTAERCD